MFREILRRLRRGDKGQALIEAALTMPLLILLLIGSVELARVIYVAIEVSNAAKAAVQFGAQNPVMAADVAAIQNAAADDAGNLANLTTTVNNTTCSCALAGTVSSTSCSSSACTSSGGYLVQNLEVTTQTTVQPLFHLPGLPSTFTLTGHASQEVLK